MKVLCEQEIVALLAVLYWDGPRPGYEEDRKEVDASYWVTFESLEHSYSNIKLEAVRGA